MQGKEFAVRLSSDYDFRAVSNPSVKYTKLVEEAGYFSDMDYDWNFLLEHWMGVKNGSVRLLDDDGRGGRRPLRPAAFDLPDVDNDVSAVKKPNGRGAKREKPKPLLKCRYCMLSYNSEKERHEHEVTWHAEKMK